MREANLTKQEKLRIWAIWEGEWHHECGEFNEMWHRYEKLEEQTGIPIKKLKQFMREMRELRVSYFTTTINSDFKPCGSGNFIYAKYIGLSFDEVMTRVGGGKQ